MQGERETKRYSKNNKKNQDIEIMATGNFLYENRCIVVTDEDYEIGNVPEVGKFYDNGCRSFPSAFLKAYEGDFWFFHIVLTNGYYQHACIDYVENGESLENVIGRYKDDFSSKKEMFEYLRSEFYQGSYGLTKYRCKKLSRGHTLESAFEAAEEWLMDKEREMVNKILDNIKARYGYEEYARAWTASNGETGYRKVG